jgi:hypothetical protein
LSCYWGSFLPVADAFLFLPFTDLAKVYKTLERKFLLGPNDAILGRGGGMQHRRVSQLITK